MQGESVQQLAGVRSLVIVFSDLGSESVPAPAGCRSPNLHPLGVVVNEHVWLAYGSLVRVAVIQTQITLRTCCFKSMAIEKLMLQFLL